MLQQMLPWSVCSQQTKKMTLQDKIYNFDD